jgi:hypothetical protein
MKVTGQVYKWFSKDWPAKRPGQKGNVTWSLKLENDPLYYRAVRQKDGNAPKTEGIEPGNTVTFEADPVNDSSAQIVGAVTKVEAAQATVASIGQTSAPTPAGQGSAREASIHYQSAQKVAVWFLDVVTKNGAVKLPVKEAAKLEALEALYDHYVSAFFQDIATFGAVARANGTDEAAEDTAKPTSDEE